jgi:site-specific recombinase XerD
VKAVKRSEIRRDRGGIRWLEGKSANELHNHLPKPWSQVFQIQCQIGLRPSEVPTLKRTDFAPDLHTLTLSPVPRTDLTLKTGPRTIGIHRYPEILPVFRDLLDSTREDLIFNDRGKPWNLDQFMKQYRRALRAAASAAGIRTKVDARIGRRTCASILLRTGKSVEQVAALLGDDPKTIREHYAAILPHEV